jgi:hypothetical protein
MTAEQKEYFVEDWEDDKQTDYIFVGDSMEETTDLHYSIEDSWKEFIESAKDGHRVIVDLSQLRPQGTINAVGLEATGAVGDGRSQGSFLAVYIALSKYLKAPSMLGLMQVLGTLNDTLRRGGLYKNGIVTSSMSYSSPYIWEYLNADITQIPGSHKKSVRVALKVLQNQSLCDLIREKVDTESVFLEMDVETEDNAFLNVCVGIFLPDRGTCLLWRVNLGLCRDGQDVIASYVKVARYLTTLHLNWRKWVGDRADIYQPLELDRQIAIDPLGMANFLAAQNVSYEGMTEAMSMLVAGDPEEDMSVSENAFQLALSFAEAFKASTEESDRLMAEAGLLPLLRIHTVEPSQSHAYQCKDLAGRTTARAIFPPYKRMESRRSSVHKPKMYNFGKVETAETVSAKDYQAFCENFFDLMKTYGRAHAISFDLRQECTEEWFKDFVLYSPLRAKYYSEATLQDQSYLKKQALTAVEICSLERPGECSVCAE